MSSPSVSIVMPVRNERDFVVTALQDLVSQDYDRITEIIAVDGESSDGTRQLVETFARKDDRIRLVNNEKRKVSPALNSGIDHSSGDIIVRADCHARYAPDYVRQCVECITETGASNVGGPAIPRADGGTVHQAILAAHLSRLGIGVAKFRRSSYEGPADTVWPGAFLRSAVNEVGPFREEFDRTEDIDFNTRLRALGHKIHVSSRIKVWYVPRNKLLALWSQNFANGRGIAETLFVNRRAVRLRHLVPLAFVVALGTAGASSIYLASGKFVLVGIAGVYMVALATAYIAALKNTGTAAAMLLPVVLVGLHLSYGTGSLAGIIRAGWKGIGRWWGR